MPICGFTTNPSILARESENVKETVAALVELTEGWRMLHIQMTADRAEEPTNRQTKMPSTMV